MLTRLRQFAALTFAERRVLLAAVVLVAAVRLALLILPFRVVARLIARPARVWPVLASAPPGRLAWAVQAAGKRTPGASCLTRALALHRLMARAGRRAKVCIGVRRDAGRRFEAHAWLEYGERVLIGDIPALEGYVSILSLGSP